MVNLNRGQAFKRRAVHGLAEDIMHLEVNYFGQRLFAQKQRTFHV
jgi:hypothetical protein